MKITSLCFAFLVSGIAVKAQDAGLPPRPYKADEMKHWSQICDGLSGALPKSYLGYTVKKENCGSFEWAERSFKNNKAGDPLTVTNKKNEPIGNHPYYNIYYTKNADSADLEEQKIQLGIQDAVKSDGSVNQALLTTISVKTEKFNQTRTLSINIQTNVKIDFSKQYFIGTKPTKIDLPIAAFGYLYLFPPGKAVLNEQGEGEGGTDANAFYKDKALIIISTKPPKVTSTPVSGKQSWKEDKILPTDAAPENIMAPIKNICVEISGGEEDVRAMIKQINWKALQSLMGK